MRLKPTCRANGGRRTSSRSSRLSLQERRRLFQLGASLAIFLLALLGRSAFPQSMEKWSGLLTGDMDLGAALTRFEESAAQGEPFLDALGELCIEVFTAADGEEVGKPEVTGEEQSGQLHGHTPSMWERRKSWNEFRESQWRVE